MSTTKTKVRHTAGRWSRNIAPASKYPVIFAGRNTHVAMVVSQELPVDEVEANCNLITAAPDLLEALEQLHAATWIKSGNVRAMTEQDWQALKDSVEAAIAKARASEEMRQCECEHSAESHGVLYKQNYAACRVCDCQSYKAKGGAA